MARRRCDTQRWWFGALWQELPPFAPGARTGMTLRPGLMLRGPTHGKVPQWRRGYPGPRARGSGDAPSGIGSRGFVPEPTQDLLL
jgi:hypothetical protein